MKPNCIILPKKNVYYTYEFSHNDDLFKNISSLESLNISKI